MITDIVLTLLMLILFGASVLLIPWVMFLVARAMIRQAHRRQLIRV